jgi:hypothetical protein
LSVREGLPRARRHNVDLLGSEGNAAAFRLMVLRISNRQSSLTKTTL